MVLAERNDRLGPRHIRRLGERPSYGTLLPGDSPSERMPDDQPHEELGSEWILEELARADALIRLARAQEAAPPHAAAHWVSYSSGAAIYLAIVLLVVAGGSAYAGSRLRAPLKVVRPEAPPPGS